MTRRATRAPDAALGAVADARGTAFGLFSSVTEAVDV